MPNDNNARANRRINLLDSAAKALLNSIDSGYKEREILSGKDAEIQSIINAELDLTKGLSGGNIIDFVSSMAKTEAQNQGRDPREVDTYTLFNENVGDLFGYYQELRKNKFIELTDLQFITKFIPAIGEAVKTTLDAICSSDDFSETISRNLEWSKALTEVEKAEVEAEVHRIEDEYKLLKNLKNKVYKKTLVTGTNYIYCIPYAELFQEYDRLVKNGKIMNNQLVTQTLARGKISDKMMRDKGILLTRDKKPFGANEATMSVENSNAPVTESAKIIIESAVNTLSNDYFAGKNNAPKKEILTEAMTATMDSVHIVDSEVLIDALEGFSAMQIMKDNLQHYTDAFNSIGILEDPSIVTTDGTATPGSNAENLGEEVPGAKFSTNGSYVKYIDATQVVPVRIYDVTIGYFYVHNMSASKMATNIKIPASGITSIIGDTAGMYTSGGQNLTDDKRNRAVQNIVDAISMGIISNFDNAFVEKNTQFKKLIADCITANGLIDNPFQIQFIPAKYMISFTVNEDDDSGYGKSILEDSLFPAKMLLSLIVSKLLLYMNKSGNKTISYIKKGAIDINTSNHLQRVIRMLQESNITFSDLLSTNISFHKFARNGNISIPMSRNGDRLVDFETQEGQDVDLRTPMEEYLEKLAIMGTGVPSVILEYTDAADYAKSIVTANIKFAGRIASFDSDLEEPTTELYRKLIMTSNLNDDLKQKAAANFEFKLCRPRVLANANMADYLGQLESTTQSMGRVMLGDNDETQEQMQVRKQFNRELAMNLLPFIRWDEYDDMLKRAKVKVAASADLNKNKGQNNKGQNGESSADYSEDVF